MSLLDDAMETFIYMNKAVVQDEYGGQKTVWTEGAEILATAVFDNSIEARVADKQGVTALYTITTRPEVNLQYHEILKRERDGKYFRVTSDGDDKVTPKSAGLKMRQVSAEELNALPR